MTTIIFNPFDEFPHTIEKGVLKLTGDFPHQTRVFVPETELRGFMDTPSAQETLQFHQMNNDYQRNLYLPFNVSVNFETDLFKYQGKIYECIGDGVDQGGMNEINLFRLKEVSLNGN